MKPIYNAPFAEQLKDLRRACEMASDLLETLPVRACSAEDLKRDGLRKGEFALCDWIVRPRFQEAGCSHGPSYPITFKDWWESNPLSPNISGARIIGGRFEVDGALALAIWHSIGLSS